MRVSSARQRRKEESALMQGFSTGGEFEVSELSFRIRIYTDRGGGEGAEGEEKGDVKNICDTRKPEKKKGGGGAEENPHQPRETIERLDVPRRPKSSGE